MYSAEIAKEASDMMTMTKRFFRSSTVENTCKGGTGLYEVEVVFGPLDPETARSDNLYPFLSKHGLLGSAETPTVSNGVLTSSPNKGRRRRWKAQPIRY